MQYKHLSSLALAGLVALAACGGSDSGASQDTEQAPVAAQDAGGMANPHGDAAAMPGQAGVTRITYKCADEKSIQLALYEGSGKADLVMEGETVTLAAETTGSGMNFTDGTWSFRGKGPEALVMKGGETVFADCKAAGHP